MVPSPDAERCQRPCTYSLERCRNRAVGTFHLHRPWSTEWRTLRLCRRHLEMEKRLGCTARWVDPSENA